MSKASMMALRDIAADAGRARHKGGRGRAARPRITVEIGEAEIEDSGDFARRAGSMASDDDDSYRASTAETAAAGATVGDLYDDDEED